MFQLFRRRRRNREIIETLYDFLADEARRPETFSPSRVPDTVMGRFEALAVEVYLFLRRCRNRERLEPVAQEIVDRLVVDVEAAIRELGVGDPAVPKRMRTITGRFYERVHAYDAAFAEGTPSALAGAVRGRLVPADAPDEAVGALCDAIRAQDARFAAWADAAILEGRPPREESAVTGEGA